MNDDTDPIATSIRRRAAQISTVAPDFADVLGHRQQRLRRRAGAASVGLLTLGVGGLFALSSTGGPNTDDLADGPPDSETPSVTIDSGTIDSGTIDSVTDVPVDARWYCEGRIDVGADGSVEGTVVPTMPMQTTTAPEGFVPDDSVPPFSPPDPGAAVEADSGFFRSCVSVDEFVGTATTVVIADPSATVFPDPTTTTFVTDDATVQATTPSDVPVTDPAGQRVDVTQIYIVQAGDVPIGVAERFCISLDDLNEYNGFVDGGDWPFPGTDISIPPGACAGPPALTTTASLPVSVATTIPATAVPATTVPPTAEG